MGECKGSRPRARTGAGEGGLSFEPLEPRYLFAASLAGAEPGPLAQAPAPDDASAHRPVGAGLEDSSEFMIGRVCVSAVCLASNGDIDTPSERWTAQELTVVKGELAEAASWWEQTYDQTGLTPDLEFVLDLTFVDAPSPTSYEPITRSSSEQFLWINEFLHAQQYASNSAGVTAFNDDQRQAHQADWAFTVFIVDSSNDYDGMFSNGWFAYSYLGGPFLVVTTQNDGWGFYALGQVVAHEMGHIFYAMDEYPGSNSYRDHSGYYRTQNLNAYDDNPGRSQRVPSIMAEYSLQREAYAGHTSSTSCLETIGWRDSDGDHIPDVLDVPLSLTGRHTYDGQTRRLDFAGQSSAVAMDNRNPLGKRRDITLNRVDRLQYRYNGGAWIDAQTLSGQASAQFDLSLTLPPGVRRLEIRTLCDRTGVGSEPYVVLTDPLGGDYNADGRVSYADYTIWKNTFGSVEDLRADGDGDQRIGMGDYDLWFRNQGKTLGNDPSGLGNALAVMTDSVALARLADLGGVRDSRPTPIASSPQTASLAPSPPRGAAESQPFPSLSADLPELPRWVGHCAPVTDAIKPGPRPRWVWGPTRRRPAVLAEPPSPLSSVLTRGL